jgi:pilus assembly protein CpaE
LRTEEDNPGAAAPVAVLVVDDQAVFRTVMREVVQSTPGMTVAGEARSGQEAVEAAEELRPRLVLMDKRMPGMDGITAARAIRERWPEMVVMLLSVEEPDLELLEASGAVAFLPKRDLSPRMLAELWRLHGPA